MGNSQSSDPPKSPSSSLTPTSSRKERDSSQRRVGGGADQNVSAARKVQRHYSHATKAPHTPPANFLPTSSAASTSTSNALAHATVSASPAGSHHSRNRSVTTGTPKLRAAGSVSTHTSDMGQNESRQQRPPSRAATLPTPSTEKQRASPTSQVVDVPQPSQQDEHNEKGGYEQADLPGSGSYGLPPSNFSRPPRMPLPIEMEPEPVSPILTPQEARTPVEQHDAEGGMPRRASMLSSTTLDDEEAADIEQFVMETDPSAQTMPTALEWKGHGKAVYVTGTFAKWEKKFRLHRNDRGTFSATIPLPVGTHHIKFLVDNEMMTSDDLPTTVDFTNALMNYIEVAGPVTSPATAQPPAPAEPMPIPGASTAPQTTESGQPLDIRSRPQVAGTESDLAATIQGTVGPEENQHTILQHFQQHGAIPRPDSHAHQHQQPHPKRAVPKPKLPRPRYTTEIPALLLHLDLYNNPEDDRYSRALKATQHLPAPPSLPQFMNKSILNAATPHKDDASVLTMPNHTVLNHLATSSIRSGVLATSGTTRYKRKVNEIFNQLTRAQMG